jgi:hypothetical protein
MSLAKSVLDGLKPQECKCIKLCEPPPIPYIPEKDEVQEEVARLRNPQIKTSLEMDNQYKMNKKGMTPMDMRLLLTSLEAIQCVCTYEKGKIGII